MRKNAVLLTLISAEVIAEGLLALYWVVMRADLGYRLDAQLGMATRVAISSWFAPLVAAVGVAPVLLAFLPGWRTRTRAWLAGGGLVWAVFGLVFAVGAAYAPAFEQLGAPR